MAAVTVQFWCEFKVGLNTNHHAGVHVIDIENDKVMALHIV